MLACDRWLSNDFLIRHGHDPLPLCSCAGCPPLTTDSPREKPVTTEARYVSSRVWTYPADTWQPARRHRYGWPYRGSDEWGRRVLVVGLAAVGYLCWAYRTCWCHDCHEVREQTYRLTEGETRD